MPSADFHHHFASFLETNKDSRNSVYDISEIIQTEKWSTEFNCFFVMLIIKYCSGSQVQFHHKKCVCARAPGEKVFT